MSKELKSIIVLLAYLAMSLSLGWMTGDWFSVDVPQDPFTVLLGSIGIFWLFIMPFMLARQKWIDTGVIVAIFICDLTSYLYGAWVIAEETLGIANPWYFALAPSPIEFIRWAQVILYGGGLLVLFIGSRLADE